jgi:nicotinate-nucleotide adenylyltransferase
VTKHQQQSQRIALFGGTFDPVHNGHLDLVALARKACSLDRAIFIPCARSPFKNIEPVASADDRCAMLDLAIAERGCSDWAVVSRFEIDRPPPSYSWQTASYFRETLPPDSRLHWIVGADQWEQIDRWAEPEKLRAWLDFIVVTRHGSPIQPREGWRATFLEFEHFASATAIRAGRGKRDWLPGSVADFAEQHRLYLV